MGIWIVLLRIWIILRQVRCLGFSVLYKVAVSLHATVHKLLVLYYEKAKIKEKFNIYIFRSTYTWSEKALTAHMGECVIWTIYNCVLCNVHGLTTEHVMKQVVKEEERQGRRTEKINTEPHNKHYSSQWSPWQLPPLYFSPIGDMCTLPPLSCQRISPLPWPRSAFVRYTTAGLLHPT